MEFRNLTTHEVVINSGNGVELWLPPCIPGDEARVDGETTTRWLAENANGRLDWADQMSETHGPGGDMGIAVLCGAAPTLELPPHEEGVMFIASRAFAQLAQRSWILCPEDPVRFPPGHPREGQISHCRALRHWGAPATGPTLHCEGCGPCGDGHPYANCPGGAIIPSQEDPSWWEEARASRDAKEPSSWQEARAARAARDAGAAKDDAGRPERPGDAESMMNQSGAFAAGRSAEDILVTDFLDEDIEGLAEVSFGLDRMKITFDDGSWVSVDDEGAVILGSGPNPAAGELIPQGNEEAALYAPDLQATHPRTGRKGKGR